MVSADLTPPNESGRRASYRRRARFCSMVPAKSYVTLRLWVACRRWMQPSGDVGLDNSSLTRLQELGQRRQCLAIWSIWCRAMIPLPGRSIPKDSGRVEVAAFWYGSQTPFPTCWALLRLQIRTTVWRYLCLRFWRCAGVYSAKAGLRRWDASVGGRSVCGFSHLRPLATSRADAGH